MKWLFALFSVLVVLLVGLAIAPSFFDWNQYKDPALEQVEGLTGLNIQIEGDVSLALLPSPRVKLEQVRVVDPTDPAQKKLMASLEQLDLHVALLPLFKGQAKVNSFDLQEPVIVLSKDEGGRFNFMTDKLERLLEGKKALEGQGQAEAPSEKFALSFDNVSIEKGAFQYKEAGQKNPVEVTDIFLDIDAGSVQGPFDGEGRFVFNGRPISFDGKTSKIDQGANSFSMNARVESQGGVIQYAGVVALGEAFEVQGETDISIDSIQRFTASDQSNVSSSVKGAFKAKGLLTASKEKINYTNAAFSFDNKSISGALDVNLQPLNVSGAFKGQDIIDLDPYLKRGGAQQKGGDLLAFTNAIPQTLEIPELGKVDVTLNVPGVVYNKNVYKGVNAKLTSTDKSFAAQIDVAEAPGSSQLEVLSALTYAEASKSSKTGKVIYSAPTLKYEVKGQSQNPPSLVKALSGMSDLPLIQNTKRGVFELSGQVVPNALKLDKGVINLDEAAYSLSGGLSKQKDSGRALLKAKVLANALNFDALSQGEKKASGDPLQALKALNLPFDADIDVSVNEAVMQGHDIKGLQIAAQVLPNALKLNTLKTDNFAGASVNASAAVNNLKAMEGITLDANVKASDPYKLAGALKVDTKSWPKDLGATDASVKASGNLNALSVDGSVSAYGGRVGAVGTVSDPLTDLKVGGLIVKASHPNLSIAIQGFAPSAPNYISLAKPMSIQAKLDMNGKVIGLSDIQGDLAGATTNGSLKIDNSGAKPAINGLLRFGDLVLKSGSSSSGASSGGGASAPKSGEKWSSAPMNNAWLHSAAVNLDVAANSIVYETWNLSKPELQTVMQNGVMKINNLKSGLYDGQIAMNGTVSASAPTAPLNVDVNSKIDNINMGALAKALAGSGRIQASGDVSLDFNVKGTGGTQKALVSSLNGAANMNGKNVVMKGFDLAGLAGALMESNKPLPRIQEILRSSTRSGETAFDTVKGVYGIQNGVVGINEMSMDGPEALIVSKGAVSLPKWSIDTTHTITLKNANEVDPFDVVIAGPLDNPRNTFGDGLFDTFVRQKLQQKVAEELPDLLGDDVTNKLQQFGILPQKKKVEPTVPETEPASGAANDNAPSAPEQQLSGEQPKPANREEVKPEEVVEDLLRGFLQ